MEIDIFLPSNICSGKSSCWSLSALVNQIVKDRTVPLTLFWSLPEPQHSSQWQQDDSMVSQMTTEERCRAFSQPNLELQEFYSPMYPNPYPKNTECILRLEGECPVVPCVLSQCHDPIIYTPSRSTPLHPNLCSNSNILV